MKLHAFHKLSALVLSFTVSSTDSLGKATFSIGSSTSVQNPNDSARQHQRTYNISSTTTVRSLKNAMEVGFTDRVVNFGPTPPPSITQSFSHSSSLNRTSHQSHESYDRIASFIRNLRIYVSDSEFDFQGFDVRIEEYRNDYADLEYSAENGSDYTEEMRNRLEAARDMFSDMVSATERMKRYTRSKRVDHRLVARMIELYIVAKSFYSSSGHDDLRVGRYIEKIYDFRNIYIDITEEYTSIMSESKNFESLIFNVYAARAAAIMDGLSAMAQL